VKLQKGRWLPQVVPCPALTPDSLLSVVQKKDLISSATTSALKGFRWPRPPGNGSANVHSGFMSKTGGSLAAPPGWMCTSGDDADGRTICLCLLYSLLA